MLSIRMQRLGRTGHPTYRVVVQDSRWSPTSGKYVALLGSYNPHTKQSTLVKDKAEFYLSNGAQPSDRVAALFKSEKINLPKWVSEPTKKSREIRNPEKLRKNRPADAEADKPADKEAESGSPEPSEETSDKPTEGTESPAPETSEQETKSDETKPAEAEKPESEPAGSDESGEEKPEAADKPSEEKVEHERPGANKKEG